MITVSFLSASGSALAFQYPTLGHVKARIARIDSFLPTIKCADAREYYKRERAALYKRIGL
jgi:hypothetical protein